MAGDSPGIESPTGTTLARRWRDEHAVSVVRRLQRSHDSVVADLLSFVPVDETFPTR